MGLNVRGWMLEVRG